MNRLNSNILKYAKLAGQIMTILAAVHSRTYTDAERKYKSIRINRKWHQLTSLSFKERPFMHQLLLIQHQKYKVRLKKILSFIAHWITSGKFKSLVISINIGDLNTKVKQKRRRDRKFSIGTHDVRYERPMVYSNRSNNRQNIFKNV